MSDGVCGTSLMSVMVPTSDGEMSEGVAVLLAAFFAVFVVFFAVLRDAAPRPPAFDFLDLAATGGVQPAGRMAFPSAAHWHGATFSPFFGK